ncbi:DUF2695 domain-containing protein [Mariniluteicoccus flavus]
MTTGQWIDDLERELWVKAQRMTLPRERECFACYTARMLGEFGCNHELRWALRYRDTRAPRATALERRLSSRGAFCDCEVFLNDIGVRAGVVRPDEPDRIPPCPGVRRGSTTPCDHWGRRVRW